MLETAKEKMNTLENTAIEIIQNETGKKKKKKTLNRSVNMKKMTPRQIMIKLQKTSDKD